MDISHFDFELPEHLIAQAPIEPRDQCRLLVSNKEHISHHKFTDLPSFLNERDLLVFNNTKVIPALLTGHKDTGAKISLNLLKKLDTNNRWQALAKPKNKLKVGSRVSFGKDFSATVVENSASSDTCTLQFNYTEQQFEKLLQKHGKTPLPPYIKRQANESDTTLYQTIYASSPGAVAAPTAGLHFTQSLLDSLKQKGIKTAFVTLHVSGGTFLPVKTQDIRRHKMHSEWFEITQENADIINNTRANGGRVIAVGTTSLRVLESISKTDKLITPSHGETNIFIYPGYKFNVVDALITNFHLPKSTLFMLVCAFLGTENAKTSYQEAISKGYRFFSYGDASLMFRNDIL